MTLYKYSSFFPLVLGEPKEPCIRWGQDSPTGRDNFGICLGVSATALYAAKKSITVPAILRVAMCSASLKLWFKW